MDADTPMVHGHLRCINRRPNLKASQNYWYMEMTLRFAHTSLINTYQYTLKCSFTKVTMS